MNEIQTQMQSMIQVPGSSGIGSPQQDPQELMIEE